MTVCLKKIVLMKLDLILVMSLTFRKKQTPMILEANVRLDTNSISKIWYAMVSHIFVSKEERLKILPVFFSKFYNFNTATLRVCCVKL